MLKITFKPVSSFLLVSICLFWTVVGAHAEVHAREGAYKLGAGDLIKRLYPKFATHDHYLWSVYIVLSGVFILYEISMECAQEYPHPQRSGKSCRRMDPMYGIRWLCS